MDVPRIVDSCFVLGNNDNCLDLICLGAEGNMAQKTVRTYLKLLNARAARQIDHWT